MSELNFQFGSGLSKPHAGSLASRVVLFLFGTPFAAFGLFAIWGGIKKFHDTGSMEGIFISLFGLVFAGFGFGMMYAALTAERRRKAAEDKWRAQTDGGSKPWLARTDWAAGRVKSSNNAQNILMGIMAVAFCGMGGMFTFLMLPEELRKGNHKALLVLIFPLVGIGLLAAFIRGLLARRRFGDCFFEMASIPGALGGTLEGLIQTGTRLRLEHGLTLKLSCIRRVVSGSGKNRSTQESILWQDEKVFNPQAGLPETEPGRTGIPVYFKIPADQPACFSQGNETILWRLESRAKMAGPDFTAAFEVPVFRVAGTVTSADEPDPTAAMQMPAEQLRRDDNSKIQVTDGLHGREFYFSAARNPGAALFLTVFFLIWSGFLWFMIVMRAPLLFPIVFGIFDVLIFWGLLHAWFKSSRVEVNSSGVTLHNRWLLFSRMRQFDAHEISRFDTKVGMTSGTKVFHDIKLITRAGEESFAARKAGFERTGGRPPVNLRVRDASGVTLGSSVASGTEAKWLVQEMTRALGRKSDNL